MASPHLSAFKPERREVRRSNSTRERSNTYELNSDTSIDMNKLKKTFASAGIGALVLTAVPAAVAGQTIEELQAQIQQLMQQIAQLQGTTPGTGITGVPAGFTFTANMGQGATGEQVRYLQIVLNSDADTRVAQTGAGSPGSETTTYGPLTAAAVSRFQQKYASEILAPLGLTSGTGFVGASTRAKLNSLLAAAPTQPTDPTTPADPAGPEVEGTLSSARLAVPSAVEIGKGQSRSVIGVELEATDSNIRVQRADVTLEKDTAGGDARPWRSFDRIQLLIDGDVVTSRSISGSADFTQDGNAYTIRLSGFNFTVPADSKTSMEVALRVRADISDSNLGKVWDVEFGNQAIRGLDGLNINQFTGGHERSFTVVADAATLSVEFNDNSPDERVVQVSTTTTTSNVTILTFNLENTSDVNVTVEDLPVELTVAGAANNRVDDVVSVAQLRRGTTTLGSVNVTHTGANEGLAEFEDIDLSVPANSTVTLEVRVTLKARTAGNYTEGASVAASVDGDAINAVYGDDEVLDNIDGEVTGENQYLFSRAPVVSFTSGSLTPGTTDATEHIGSAVITFTVQAQGGTIFVNLDQTTVGASAEQVSATSTVWSVTGSATSVTGTDDWDGESLRRISSGSTATFEVAFLLENDDTGPINVRGLIEALTWGTAADGTGEQTWDDENLFNLIENLRTPLRLLAEGPA